MRRPAPQQRAAHERAMLIGIAVLLLLGTIPIFAHHLPVPGIGAMGDIERIGVICMVALHLLVAPVHGFIHLLLLGGAGYATFDRVRAAFRLKRALHLLDLRPPPRDSRLARKAWEVNIPPSRVYLASGRGCPAFTFGGLRPKVCIAQSLESSLSDDELRCVLAHEACHVRRRDPLRLSVLRFLGLTLFWIPALRRMAADVAIDAELEADRVGGGSRPLVMASALLKAAEERTTLHLALVTTLVRDDLLAVRVRRLAGDSPSVPTRVSSRAFTGAFAALCVVWLTGAVVAHPLDTHGVSGGTCLDHSGSAASHLFCTHRVADGVPCPHAVAAGPATSHAH